MKDWEEDLYDNELSHRISLFQAEMTGFSEMFGDQELILAITDWFDEHMGGTHKIIKEA